MGERRHFLFRARRDGRHVRVAVWAGTSLEKTTGGRPNIGELCMAESDWIALQAMLLTGHQGNVTIENPPARRSPVCGCGHGGGYHTGPTGDDPPVKGARCYANDCGCRSYTIEQP